MKNKAVFLDRDGVINFDPDEYTFLLEETFILEGIIDFAKQLQNRGYLLIVITNQGGIDKKIYDYSNVEAIHSFIDSKFKEQGVTITDFYYCPHHSDLQKCLCRKPDSLLIEKAIHKYNIDPKQSYFIGDKMRDVECGEKAGVKGIKITVNQIEQDLISHII